MLGFIASKTSQILGKKWVTDATGKAVYKRDLPFFGQGAKEIATKTLPKYLQAGAIFAGAGALAGWAGSNVYQTGVISRDQQRYLEFQEENLDWQQEKFWAEEEARQEEYEHGLLQSGIIEAFDVKDRQFQSQMQASQQNYETAMYTAKINQMNQDRNTYLANQAFQTFTGGRMTPKDDQFTIAFILTELIAMSNQGQNQETDQPDLDPYYEPSYDDYDYYTDYTEE